MPQDTRFLVIDDSLAVRMRMQAYLQRLGYTNVQSAATVEEGLALFRDVHPGIVFLDMLIEEERGLDFAAPALAEAPLTEIVVMSALPADDEQVTAAIAEGARDYLPKPVTFPAVERVLQRLASDRPEDVIAAHKPPPPDESYR